MEDYVAHANRETMVLALIEDRHAVEHLEAILEVDGIDVVFIGASDLAQSMGYPGDRTTPRSAPRSTALSTGVSRLLTPSASMPRRRTSPLPITGVACDSSASAHGISWLRSGATM
jgi:hypothetical protein